MNKRKILKLRLIADFSDGFFNDNEDFIVHKYSNTYFIFKNCQNELDVQCELLERLSRPCSKGCPYKQEFRNKKYRQYLLDGINNFLQTNFTFQDMLIIYEYLGNCVNHKLTIKFIESGYDFKILEEK